MSEVDYFSSGNEQPFNSLTEAIRWRRLHYPHETISIVFAPKNSDVAKAEIVNENGVEPPVVYFDGNIKLKVIDIALTQLRKAKVPISFHLPIDGNSKPEFIDYGLKLAEDHSLLNGLPPLFLIEGKLPEEYREIIVKNIKQGKIDAVFSKNVP